MSTSSAAVCTPLLLLFERLSHFVSATFAGFTIRGLLSLFRFCCCLLWRHHCGAAGCRILCLLKENAGRFFTLRPTPSRIVPCKDRLANNPQRSQLRLDIHGRQRWQAHVLHFAAVGHLKFFVL